MNMLNLTGFLFKPHTLVVIRLETDELIQGTVISVGDECITIMKEDGTEVYVTEELLSRSTYCYTGFPMIQERVIPLMIDGNGTVSSFENGQGLIACKSSVAFNVQSYRIQQASLLDERLRALSENGELVNTSVLYAVPDNQSSSNRIAYIIKAGPLDDVLDEISSLAALGKIEIAYKFCELVLKQHPDEEDVKMFYEALHNAAERMKPIDYYEPLPEAKKGEPYAYGRIYELFDDHGTIIDVYSHKKLFFRLDQLYGGLEDMISDDLIGQPVLYSVMKYYDQEKYQARTVFPIMPLVDVHRLAKDLAFNNRKVTACDMLRIIIQQTDDESFIKDYDYWSRDQYVQNHLWDDYLWEEDLFSKYSGKTVPLYLPVTKEIHLSLERKSDHKRAIAELTKTPEAPSIMSAKTLEAILASYENNKVASKVENDSEEEDDELEEELVPTVEKAEVKVKGLPSVLPSLDNCPDANAELKSKATIMVAWREGTLFVPEEEQPYQFRMEDIIDLDLRRRAEVYSTKFIQDLPVVCQLSRAEHKATYISSPKKVIEMLSAARDAIICARAMDDTKDRISIYDEYTRAYGYTSLVLDAFPGHTVARSLQVIAHEALERFSDTCYKAPFNAIKPCGEIIIKASKKKPNYYVSDPLFLDKIMMPKSSIIDRDYEKLHVGDDLVYSIYPGSDGKPIVRFACLARPSLELIGMAEEYEKEKNYENAWGIAMSVLDADPSNPDAHSIVDRCEPLIDEETVEKRQQVVRENLFAQGQAAAISGDSVTAIALFERIIRSQDENRAIKEASALRILEIYSMLLSETPDNKEIKLKYKKAGEKYILKKHFSSFSITGSSLREIEVIIQFYSDMEDIAGLISAYQRKIDLLLKEPNTRDNKEAISQTNATIAWYYLLAGDSDAPEVYASRANSDEEYVNDLGRVCEAIIKLRYSDTSRIIKVNGNYSSQSIPTLSGTYVNQYADKVVKGRVKNNSLTFERFALLCAIIKNETLGDGKDVLHYLGRYLASLTGNDSEYKTYVTSTRTVPEDCNFVRQVFKCLRYGPAWRFWMDIRLVCMLSEEASYQISSAMYCLDPSIAANVLIRSDVDIYTKPSAAVFARGFAQWRGATLLPKYNDYLNKTEDLQKDTNLGKCVEFFRDLSFEMWMTPDDQEIINEIRRQLPSHLTSFITAETSRAVKTTSREILDSISEWLDFIKERPTVLTRCAFYDLLWQIRKEVEKKEKEQHFSVPVLKAKVLATSVLDTDGSLYLEVEIHNKDKKAEPIQECHLRLLPSDDIIPDVLNPVVTYSETDKVFGDETILYILHFRINQQADFNNLSLSLHFDYKVKNSPVGDDFNLKFKPLKKWNDIENFFNPGAPEYNHFYGRQAYIKKVVSVFSDPGNTPHFFIYGQKRSGKSSVLYQIQKQLQERIPTAILVKVDFLGLQLRAESDFYYLILKRILQTVDFANKKAKSTPGKDCLPQQVLLIPKKDETDYDLLLSRLWDLKAAFKETKGWEESRLILFIDEFTVAYEGLLAGLIPKEFMHRWKSLQAEGLFGAVLVGQDVLHSFINATEGPNAFDILDKERLNYLEPDEAKRLIIETMENLSNRKDVFIGNAVDQILYYSASSAHYTKWVCSRLIDYMNARKQPKVTKADIDAVVWRSIQSMQPTLLKALFDPLIFPGLKENLSRFTGEQTLEIMDIVADEELSNSIRGCRRNAIVAGCKKTPPSIINEIISDLVERGVLIEDHENYKIRLKLFSVWYQVRNTLQSF